MSLETLAKVLMASAIRFRLEPVPSLIKYFPELCNTFLRQGQQCLYAIVDISVFSESQANKAEKPPVNISVEFLLPTCNAENRLLKNQHAQYLVSILVSFLMPKGCFKVVSSVTLPSLFQICKYIL